MSFAKVVAQRLVLALMIAITGLPGLRSEVQTGTAADESGRRRAVSRALNSLGAFYYENQDYEKAISCFEDALHYDPTDDDTRVNLAVAWLQRGGFEKVIQALSSVQPPESDRRAITALAVSYFALGKYQQAVGYYEKLARLEPEDSVLRLTLAVSYQLSGQSEKADKIISAMPKQPAIQAQYHVILGDAHRSRMNVPQAVAEYERALALEAGLPDVNYRLGVLYSDLNSYEKAAAAFQRELALNPDNPHASYSLGGYYLALNDLERAAQYFRKTVQSNSTHLGAYIGMMTIELSQNRPAQALEWAKQAEAGAGENGEFHYLKSRAYNLLGQKEEAEKELKVFQEIKKKQTVSK